MKKRMHYPKMFTINEIPVPRKLPKILKKHFSFPEKDSNDHA